MPQSPATVQTRPREQMSPARLKLALLSHGVCFPLDAFASIERPFYDNQYVYGRTSRGALRSHRMPQVFRLGDGVISAVLRREASPWTVSLDGDRVIVTHRDGTVSEIELPERPAYFGRILGNGQLTDDFIAVAGEATPGFFVYPACHYFPAGVPCAFCSLCHTRKTAGKEMASAFPLDVVAEATRIFQSTPWKEIPIISITTGTFPDNDEGARVTSGVVKAIYDALNPKIPIHVLTMPPDSFDLIALYRQAGATSIAFNLEVFNRDAFARICPGKERFYGYDKMREALRRAVDVFGAYNVFSGFVWGLEPPQSLLDGYSWCLDNAISVSSNVFHADQGSLMVKREHPSEEFILTLCEAQSKCYERYPGARTIFPMSMRSTLDWEIHRGDFR
jgi:bacteriochlorophyllide c C-7(1)-hydroxylase